MTGRDGTVRVAAMTLVFAVAVAAPSLGGQSLDEARTELRSGAYDAAIETLTQLARRDAASAETARTLTAALFEVGRYREAEDAARRFIRTNPSSPELWNVLGEVLHATGDRDGAEDAFARAVTGRASDRLDARLNLAMLWFERGERDRAMQEFDGFIDVYNGSDGLGSGDLTAVATAVKYLGRRDPQMYKDALRAYDEAIARDPDALEPRVLVGELFLEKYVGTEARASFDEVLKRNASHPRALLGLAKTARFEGAPDAIEHVRRSLEINPNAVAARAFLATLLIELEDYDGAAVEVTRALDVDAGSLEALAVSAAVHFLTGDDRAFETTVARAKAINPSHADLYTTLADVSAKNRRYHEAVAFARQAVGLDSASWRGYSLLGMNQLRTGAVTAGRANLETAFAGDPYDVWTKNTLDLLDTLTQYPVTETERFRFAIDGKESELLTLYMGPLAEEAYSRLSAQYAYRPETPLRVEVFPDHADFSVRTVGLVGLGALGVSFGPVVAMDSPSARRVGEFNWGSTLWHEIAHSFHLGMTDGRVPRWFTEGLAVFEERRARPGWGTDVVPGFLQAYRDDRLAPVSDLNRGFMRPAYPEQIGFSYYQASLVCELIDHEYGSDALVAMLAGFKRGETTSQVFQTVLGTAVDDFAERFDAYLAARFATPLASLKPRPVGGVTERGDMERRARLDESDFLAQLAMGKRLFENGQRDEAARYFERAKLLFPEYAGPDSPYWYLAQIHKANGASRRAADELARLTGINEQLYRAHVELADLLLSLNDSVEAVEAYERAMFISPYDVDVHVRLAEIESALGRHDGAIRERRAVLALDPVDRADALYELARSYFAAGHLDAARRTVLRALEVAPGFERAQDLLLEIHSVRGGTGR